MFQSAVEKRPTIYNYPVLSLRLRNLKFGIPNWAWLLAILVLAGGVKLVLVSLGTVPFNSDEAVVALMARHILQGERPIFFYGQAYMGSLDAWLVAAGFRLFGEVVWVIRFAQGMLYMGTIITAAWIGRVVFKNHRVGNLAALLLAIPAVNVTLYTTVSLGGYGEALLIGNLLVLTGLKIGEQFRLSRWPGWYLWLIVGFLSGLSLWAFALALVYVLPVAVYLIYRVLKHPFSKAKTRRRKWVLPVAALLGGTFLGSLPWWIFAAKNGFHQLIWELRGGAIAGVERLPLLGQFGQHLLNLTLFGGTVIFGLRPPWSVLWLALPLAPFALTIWFTVIVRTARMSQQKDEQNAEKLILVGIILSLTLAFVISPFGADPSGRYFLPFAIPLALFAGDLINQLISRYGRFAWGVAALILVFNLWGTIECVKKFPPGITTQFDRTTQIDQRKIGDLISFLLQQGEHRGYTNYWVAYPLAFLSQEELIFIPLLPTHADFRYSLREDRYSPYDTQVASSPRTAYITANVPVLDQYLREKFNAMNVHWNEVEIGNFHVFYNLSARVEPIQIGLGRNNP